MKKSVVIGMSGGVDSSAAAWLLKRDGFDVTGVTMRFQDGSAARAAESDARAVADCLGIPHFVLDFREEFRKNVVDYFVREYRQGRTPNPCVVCNRRVKWAALMAARERAGADFCATGHYARVVRLPNGRVAVAAADYAPKDQTYALYNLSQEQLACTLFPNASRTKPELRDIAERAGLPVARKPDSQEICFIPDGDYAAFIDRYTGEKSAPGNFVGGDGTVLGRHQGITHYTVGQRRGLGVACGHRVFVREIRPETNEVVLSDNDALFTDRLVCGSLNWMAIPDLAEGENRRAVVKIRYHHAGTPAVIRGLPDGRVECRFDEPVRAVTPGQSAVFYKDGIVLGGGVIDREKSK